MVDGQGLVGLEFGHQFLPVHDLATRQLALAQRNGEIKVLLEPILTEDITGRQVAQGNRIKFY